MLGLVAWYSWSLADRGAKLCGSRCGVAMSHQEADIRNSFGEIHSKGGKPGINAYEYLRFWRADHFDKVTLHIGDPALKVRHVRPLDLVPHGRMLINYFLQW